MSSNAVTIGRAALLVVDVAAAARRLAVGRRAVVRGRRRRPGRARPADPLLAPPARPGRGRGADARAARRACTADAAIRGRSGSRIRIRSAPSPRSTATVHDALRALEETVGHELNFAGENALIIADEDVALPNGNPHAAPLANAIDGLRTALAQSAALIAARVSTLLDSSLTRAAAVPGTPAGPRVRRARARVHRPCRGRRGPLAGDPGRRPDGLRLPRASSRTRASRRSPRAAPTRRSARCESRSRPSWSSPSGRCGSRARSRSGAGTRRAVAGGDRAPGPRPRRPPAAARCRGGAPADRGLGSRARLTGPPAGSGPQRTRAPGTPEPARPSDDRLARIDRSAIACRRVTSRPSRIAAGGC